MDSIPLLPLLMAVAWVLFAVFIIGCLWRIMLAHEKLAEAAMQIAQKKP
jgi:hypothetical protein